jgi:hypothetical protein
MARRDEVAILSEDRGQPLLAQFRRPRIKRHRPSSRGDGGPRVPSSSITARESIAAALCGDGCKTRKTNAELRAVEEIDAWPSVFDRKNRPAGVTRGREEEGVSE